MDERFMRELKESEDPVEGEVEAIIKDGPRRGKRFAVKPKDHAACHRSGRIIFDGKPDVCKCISRPVEKECGFKTEYDVTYGTPETRNKARRARLELELTRSRTALTEAMEQRDATITTAREGISAARTRAAVLSGSIAEQNRTLELLKDDQQSADTKLAGLRNDLKVAELVAEHATLLVKEAQERLDVDEKALAGAVDTGQKLEGHVVYLEQKSEQASRINGIRRSIARAEEELKKLTSEPAPTPQPAAPPA